LEAFIKALSDPEANLSYPVLVGSRMRKGCSALSFMGKNKYDYEKQYLEVIWNWRRTGDERGLSDLQRIRYNYHFLNMILKELMPWCDDEYDFAHLEVTR